ncbi:MAG: signal peptide peptidase SppA [Acidobacteriaceae bacterium]
MRETPPKRSFWFWTSVAGGVFLVFVAVFWGLALMSMGGDRSSFASFRSNQIAVVDLTGTIDSADAMNDQLERFANDGSIKAIILHIDSPGGGAAASQEIYHEVLRIRTEHKKRIVASIESVGASGAYYVASATDRIYANQASIVGSIGVIAQWVNYGDLLQWAKMKDVTIKAGALKDAGSPTRDLTPEERAYFQALIDNMHLQFIADVALGRHLTVQQIQPLATGQVWTGEQALPLHLIDQTGGFHEALMDTARAVGIRGEPTIVRPERPHRGLLDAILGAGSRSLFPSPDALLDKAPGFYFLWK